MSCELMSPAALLGQFVTYGLITTAFTRDWKVSMTWYLPFAVFSWLVWHSFDVITVRIQWNMLILSIVFLWAIVGSLYSWRFRYPALFRNEFIRPEGKRRVFAPESFLLWLSSSMLFVSGLAWSNNFSKVCLAIMTAGQELTVAIVLLVLGLATLIGTLIYAFFPLRGAAGKAIMTDRRLNMKYGLLLGVRIALHGVYDFLHAIIAPWHTVVFLAGLIVYWLLAWPIIGFINPLRGVNARFLMPNTKRRGIEFRALETRWAVPAQALMFIVVTAVIDLSTQVIFIIVDNTAGPSFNTRYITVMVLGGVWCLLIALLPGPMMRLFGVDQQKIDAIETQRRATEAIDIPGGDQADNPTLPLLSMRPESRVHTQ